MLDESTGDLVFENRRIDAATVRNTRKFVWNVGHDVSAATIMLVFASDGIHHDIVSYYLDEICQALESSTTLMFLELVVEEHQHLSVNERQQSFEHMWDRLGAAIGEISQLRSVKITANPQEELDMNAAACLLRHMQNVETVSVDGNDITRVIDEPMACKFGLGLSGLENCKEFSLCGVSVAHLGPILSGLSRSSSLKDQEAKRDVELDFPVRNLVGGSPLAQDFGLEDMRAFLFSGNFENITFENAQFSNRGIQALADAIDAVGTTDNIIKMLSFFNCQLQTRLFEVLQRTKAISSLNIIFGQETSNSSDWPFWLSLLGKSQHISSLSLDIKEPLQNGTTGTAALLSLGKALLETGEASTIRTLDLGVTFRDEKDFGKVLSTLLQSRTLVLLRLKTKRETLPINVDTIREYVHRELAKNYFLLGFEISFYQHISPTHFQVSPPFETLEKYTKLNRNGRRYLAELDAESSRYACELLGATEIRHDLDCIFLHLREIPQLCDISRR